MAEFKIAEGFVEVGAKVDRSQARKAASEAGGIAAKAFGDESEKVGRDRKSRFFSALFTPNSQIVMALRTGIPAVLGSPIGAAAVSLGGMFAASFAGAVLGSGALLAVGGGFAALAAVVLRHNEEIQQSFQSLTLEVTSGLRDAAQSLIPIFSDSLTMLEGMFESHIQRPLTQIFEGIGPIVQPLLRDMMNGVQNFLDAFAAPEALEGLRDFFTGIEGDLARLGEVVGEFFTKIMVEGPLAAEGFSVIVSVIENLLNFTADAINVLTQMFVGFADIWGVIEVAIHPVVDLLGAIIGLANDLHPAVILVGTALATATVAVKAFGSAARAAMFMMGPWGLLIGTVATALAAFSAGSDEAESSQRDLLQVMREVNDATGRQARELAGQELAGSDAAEAAKALGIDLSDLTDIMVNNGEGLDDLRSRMQRLVDEGTNEMHGAMGHTQTMMTEEAENAKIVIEWLNNLQGAQEQTAQEETELAEAVGITSEKIAEQGEVTAEQTKKMAESWAESVEQITEAGDVYSQMLEDLEEDEKASLEAYLETMEKRVQAATEHNENVVTITERASEDVKEQLRQDAIENPELAQMMANATDKQWAKLEEFARTRMDNASAAMQNALETDIPVMERIAENAGQAVAEGIARKIREGKELTVGETRAIMNEVETEAEAREIIPSIDPLLNERAREIVDNRLDELSSPRSVSINPHINPATGRVHIPGAGGSYAHGGIVGGAAAGGARGGDIVVNDGLEPEAIRVPDGSMVIPSLDQAFDRNQLSGSGGGVTVNMYVQGSILSERDVERIIRDSFLRGGLRGVTEQ